MTEAYLIQKERELAQLRRMPAANMFADPEEYLVPFIRAMAQIEQYRKYRDRPEERRRIIEENLAKFRQAVYGPRAS